MPLLNSARQNAKTNIAANLKPQNDGRNFFPQVPNLPNPANDNQPVKSANTTQPQTTVTQIQKTRPDDGSIARNIKPNTQRGGVPVKDQTDLTPEAAANISTGEAESLKQYEVKRKPGESQPQTETTAQAQQSQQIIPQVQTEEQDQDLQALAAGSENEKSNEEKITEAIIEKLGRQKIKVTFQQAEKIKYAVSRGKCKAKFPWFAIISSLIASGIGIEFWAAGFGIEGAGQLAQVIQAIPFLGQLLGFLAEAAVITMGIAIDISGILIDWSESLYLTFGWKNFYNKNGIRCAAGVNLSYYQPSRLWLIILNFVPIIEYFSQIISILLKYNDNKKIAKLLIKTVNEAKSNIV